MHPEIMKSVYITETGESVFMEDTKKKLFLLWNV